MTDKPFDKTELQVVQRLTNRLMRHQVPNVEKWQYYDEKQAMKNMGIAVPESMLNVKAVVGWAAIVVDSMKERMKWQGFLPTGKDSAVADELNSLAKINGMKTEVSTAVLDGLITGIGFLSVTQGDEAAGEPKVIVRAISSLNATFEWSRRLKRATRGLVLTVGEDGERVTTLYTLNSTIEETVWPDGKKETRRFEHGRNRCALVPIPSYLLAGVHFGKSELSKAILYIVDHAVRTMLGMEYNREIYTAPHRYFTNTEPEQLGFEEADSPWEIAERGYKVSMMRTTVIPPNEEGDKAEPKVGSFDPAPPTPYIEQMEMLARQIAARAGLSPTKFGYTTSNPPSADAIRADTNSHVAKATDSIDFVDEGMREVAYLMLSILHGKAPSVEQVESVASDWRDPATPTPAAAVDQAQKLVASGIVPGDSEVLLKMCYFSPDEIQQIKLDRQRSMSAQLLEQVRENAALGAAAPATDSEVEGLVNEVEVPSGMSTEDVAKAFDGLGKAIRSGVDPNSAAEKLGLGGLKFTGLLPVSLKERGE